jgi:hypothetical protein
MRLMNFSGESPCGSMNSPVPVPRNAAAHEPRGCRGGARRVPGGGRRVRRRPDRRHRDTVQLPRDQQSHQTLSIPLVGLHAIRRTARDQPRRAHQTIHPRRLQPPRQRKPRRPRLIRRPHRTIQPRDKRRDLPSTAREPLPAKLPRLPVDDRRDTPRRKKRVADADGAVMFSALRSDDDRGRPANRDDEVPRLRH